MKSRYVLMNKDMPVMTFSLTEVNGVCSYENISVCGKLPLPFDETIFSRERAKHLSEFVRSSAVKMLEIIV